MELELEELEAAATEDEIAAERPPPRRRTLPPFVPAFWEAVWPRTRLGSQAHFGASRKPHFANFTASVVAREITGAHCNSEMPRSRWPFGYSSSAIRELP